MRMLSLLPFALSVFQALGQATFRNLSFDEGANRILAPKGASEFNKVEITAQMSDWQQSSPTQPVTTRFLAYFLNSAKQFFIPPTPFSL